MDCFKIDGIAIADPETSCIPITVLGKLNSMEM